MYVILNHETVIALERIVAVVDASGAGKSPVREEAAGNGTERTPAPRTAVVLDDGRSVLLRSSRETVIRKLEEERAHSSGEKRLGG